MQGDGRYCPFTCDRTDDSAYPAAQEAKATATRRFDFNEIAVFGVNLVTQIQPVDLTSIPEDMSEWYEDYLKKEEALFARREAEARKTVAALVQAIEEFRKWLFRWGVDWLAV